MADGTKYLEGNYSTSNPFAAITEWAEDLKQAQELDKAEAYMEDYMQKRKKQSSEHHYLVDGAVLTCTCCTIKPQKPNRKSFTAPADCKEVLLKTTQNSTAKNSEEQCFATIKDCKKFENIKPFGNCKNPPDREKEKKAIMLAEESAELLKLGTCRYLMELNDEWENILSNHGYEELTGSGGELQEIITMESILFCKHGGFIYPIDPGYIKSIEDMLTWLDCVKEVGAWYVKNISTYCHMTWDEVKKYGESTARGRKGYECDVEGNLDGLKVSDDCSGFVWACLVQAGYFDSSVPVYTSGSYLPGGGGGLQMEEAGFTWHPGSEITGKGVQEGDILVKDGHIEIFEEYGDYGYVYSWTWGSVYDALPAKKGQNKDNIFGGNQYEGIWRLEDEESKE